MMPFQAMRLRAASGGSGGSGGVPWANVAALLHMDGANGSTTFTDEKGATYTRTNTPTISTTESKFGGASGVFANNSAVVSPDSTAYGFSGDVTVEMWVRPNAVNVMGGLWSLYNSAGPYAYITSAGKVLFYSGSASVTSTASLVANTWTHLAFVRSGTNWRVYINGVQDGGPVSGGAYSTTRTFHLGANVSTVGGTGGMAGYFDDVRLVIGTAVYTAAFTPPTAAHPDS